jgi:hypothetical protein
VSILSSWVFESDGAEIATSFRSRLSVNTIDAALSGVVANRQFEFSCSSPQESRCRITECTFVECNRFLIEFENTVH